MNTRTTRPQMTITIERTPRTFTVDGNDIQVDPKTIPTAGELAQSIELGTAPKAPISDHSAPQGIARQHSDAPMCMMCGVQMQRAGSCHACPSCGSTSGCS